MKRLQRWRQTTIANQVMSVTSVFMMVATIAIAFAAILQFYTSRNQLSVMHDQVDAAKNQSKLMQGQLSVMRDQADSMKEQTNTLKDSLTETRKTADAAVSQSNTSQVSAKAAETSAKSAEESLRITRQAMTLETRAYVVVNSLVPDFKRGIVTVWLENIGKRPATNINLLVATAMPSGFAFEAEMEEVLSLGDTELFPGSTKFPVVIRIKNFTPQSESLILSRQTILHVGCDVTYETGYGRATSYFTFYYLPPPDDKWVPRGFTTKK